MGIEKEWSKNINNTFFLSLRLQDMISGKKKKGMLFGLKEVVNIPNMRQDYLKLILKYLQKIGCIADLHS